MYNHLSIDEITEFSSAKRIDPAFYALAAKVNSHIMQCEECREEYHAFLDVGTAIDKVGVSGLKPQLADNQVDKKMAKVREQLREAGLSISKFVSGWGGLSLKIQTLRAMECEVLDSMTSLYHPAYFAVAKSIGKASSTRAVQPPVIKSTLTDGKGSRLSIGEDGTLSFFLNKEAVAPNAVAALVPEGDSSMIHFRFLEQYGDSEFMARFENVEPGEYFAALIQISPDNGISH